MDVFYGDAWCVTSRVDAWRDARESQPPRKRARKRLGMEQEQQPTLQMLDRALLRDVGAHAGDFMRAVRMLPHFKPVWNTGTTRAGMVFDGALNASERTFRKHFAAATGLLDAKPLCAQDRYDVLMCLYQRVPAVTARRRQRSCRAQRALIACLS